MSLARVRLRFVCAMVLYGTIGPMTRFIDIPAEVIVLVRGSVGALLVLLFRLATRGKPDWGELRPNLGWLVASGICLGFNWVFLFTAYNYTTVAVASLCDYMAPIFLIALTPLLFKERIGHVRLVCVIAAFAGIVLVSDLGGAISGGVDLTGAALGFIAAFGFMGVVICNKRVGEVDAFDKVVIQLAASAVVVLPYVLVANGGTIPLGGSDTLSYVLLAVLVVVQTGFAYVLYFGAMGELPVQEIVLMGYIEPMVSVLGSALVLREPLGLTGAIGAALVIVAAAVGELASGPAEESPSS